MKFLKKSPKKWLTIGALFLLLLFGFLLLQKQMYPASNQAQILSEQAVHTKDYTFYTSKKEHSTSIILYPGALVDPASYSVLAQQIATAGYDVYVVSFPFNLAVLKGNIAEKILQTRPEETFVLAGHSLGGVMASRFAAKNKQQIAGLLFLASYPDEKGDLSKLDWPVLSITATNDGVLNQANYEQAKAYLPSQTRFVSIEGGNHAGFGLYGPQKGDSNATITPLDQQTQIAQTIVHWLETAF